ncbi:MAG TPA: hypothetical protein VM029_12375 [Opitutaceae bacterium]|nr:hypothetical protein [Opitutaceae bacterium]
MSVAEIKAQADTLSFEQVSELARHLRILALRKDPRRRAQLHSAEQSNDWLSGAELEKYLADRAGK